MKVTVVGTGNMGSAFAKQLSSAGHTVQIVGRTLDKARAVADQFPGVEASLSGDVLRDTEVIILATAYVDAVTALKGLGDLTGKIVIDITNPLSADYMSLTIGHQTSAAEEIAKSIPEAHIVKAFNTLFAQVLADGPLFANAQQGTVFVASDNERAKQTATVLAQGLGWSVVDSGPLPNARYLEPLAGLNIYLGYGAGLGTSVAPTWLYK